jgi:SAM-dependent methyltransferase
VPGIAERDTIDSRPKVQDDFDRIARLTNQPDAFGPHEAALLDRARPEGRRALDLGCGTGALARRLSRSFRQVVALDLSVGMLAAARRAAPIGGDVHFVAAEMTSFLEASPETFDCITAFAVLHHGDLPRLLELCRDALRSGGVLLVVDLIERPGWRELPRNGVGWLVNQARAHLGPHRRSRALRQAWHEHGAGERYPRFNDVRTQCNTLLPGAIVRHHLLWRYSIEWRKRGA